MCLRENKCDELEIDVMEKGQFCMRCGAQAPVGAEVCCQCGEVFKFPSAKALEKNIIETDETSRLCVDCRGASPILAEYCPHCGAKFDWRKENEGIMLI